MSNFCVSVYLYVLYITRYFIFLTFKGIDLANKICYYKVEFVFGENL